MSEKLRKEFHPDDFGVPPMRPLPPTGLSFSAREAQELYQQGLYKAKIEVVALTPKVLQKIQNAIDLAIKNLCQSTTVRVTKEEFAEIGNYEKLVLLVDYVTKCLEKAGYEARGVALDDMDSTYSVSWMRAY